MFARGDWSGPFLESGLTLTELWLAYTALGGNQDRQELDDYMTGTEEPIAHEHDLLAQTLNERLHDLGKDWPVPYFETASPIR